MGGGFGREQQKYVSSFSTLRGRDGGVADSYVDGSYGAGAAAIFMDGAARYGIGNRTNATDRVRKYWFVSPPPPCGRVGYLGGPLFRW